MAHGTSRTNGSNGFSMRFGAMWASIAPFWRTHQTRLRIATFSSVLGRPCAILAVRKIEWRSVAPQGSHIEGFFNLQKPYSFVLNDRIM